MKNSGTVLVQNNGIYRSDLTVIHAPLRFRSLIPFLLILPQKHIRGITGSPLSRKRVAVLLISSLARIMENRSRSSFDAIYLLPGIYLPSVPGILFGTGKPSIPHGNNVFPIQPITKIQTKTVLFVRESSTDFKTRLFCFKRLLTSRSVSGRTAVTLLFTGWGNK